MHARRRAVARPRLETRGPVEMMMAVAATPCHARYHGSIGGNRLSIMSVRWMTGSFDDLPGPMCETVRGCNDGEPTRPPTVPRNILFCMWVY